MKRAMLLMRFFAVLGLALWMFGAASVQTMAQDGETSEQTAEETPADTGNGTTGDEGSGGDETGDDTSEEPAEEPSEEPSEEPTEAPAPGFLTVQVFSCSTGGDAGTGAVFPEGGFAPDESCAEGDATIVIDSGEASDVSGSADFTLDAGVHNVADATTGAALDVEVVSDATTTVSVVGYVTPEEEEDEGDDDAKAAEEDAEEEGDDEVDAAAVETTVRIIKHVCEPTVTIADFDVLTAEEKLLQCPVITLVEDAPAEDDVVRGVAADFDFALDDAEDDADTAVTLTVDGVPASDQVCEVDLPNDVDGDDSNNLCFDISGYDLTVPGTTIAAVETPPTRHRLGAVVVDEADSDATATLGGDLNTFTIETGGDTEIAIHAYNFFSERVNVIVHNCDDTIVDATDLEDLATFDEKLLACPAVTLDGDVGPDHDGTGGASDFELDLTDALGVDQADGTFDDAVACEDTLGVNLDEGDAENLCLPGYVFDDVAQGPAVTIIETPPTDFDFGTALIAPDSGDPALTVEPNDWTVTFDTTDDGYVTVHIFNFLIPEDDGEDPDGEDPDGEDPDGEDPDGEDPDGEDPDYNDLECDAFDFQEEAQDELDFGSGDPQKLDPDGNGWACEDLPYYGDGSNYGEQQGTGWVVAYTLYCLTSSEYVEVVSGAPGEDIDPYAYGDDTCIPDGNEVQITNPNGNDEGTFSIDASGQSESIGLASNGDEGPYWLTDTFSGVYGEFDIDADLATEVVVLVWEYDGGDEEYYPEDDEYYPEDAEEAVASGEDLPDTGTGATVASNPVLIALLGFSSCLLLLGGAYQLRRGSRW